MRRQHFFFEKKKQKTFVHWRRWPGDQQLKLEKFLVLFSKKLLSSFAAPNFTARLHPA
jgi:hypothetical protein